MKIGVLTGGGDCPGLNAAIRAVARRAAQFDYETIGICNGWAGLLGDGDYLPLDPKAVAGIMQVGGTILGAGRTNPFQRDPEVDEAIARLQASGSEGLRPAIERLEEYQSSYVEQHKNAVLRNMAAQGIDALVVIGGKDTLLVAQRFSELGVPIAAVPKTMDNDLPETDYCIGFNSAITRVTEALDNLHATATAHNRVFVVEVMGGDTGWVALMAGLAGGADYIIVPEVPTDIRDVCRHLVDRHARGKRYSLVVVSEGAECPGTTCSEPGARDAFGHQRLDKRGIGAAVAREIERRTRFETRHVVLGHLHRGGSPTVFDRVLATRLGVAAVDLLRAGDTGKIAVLRENRVKAVPLDLVAGKTRPADRYFYDLAEIFFGLRQAPTASNVRRIGVLTGGGDCPGLNGAIRAVTRRAFEHGWQVVGIKNGWAGLMDGGESEEMTSDSVSGILHQGGTMLGTSRTNPARNQRDMDEVKHNFARIGLDALVAIGGDDTLGVAARLHQQGLPVVGVPKTMDNDIAETDYCIGFDSAVTTVSEALDKLHTTALSHHRALVVEVMGRDAGWVAVYGGLAGGADYILAPEVPCRLADVCEHLQQRVARGKSSSIIVVSEGAHITDLTEEEDLGTLDAFGHVRLDKRGLGEKVAKAIESRIHMETRNVVLGHLQRGGSPTVFDRVLATRTGVAAADLIRDGQFGYVPVLKGDRIVPVELERAVASTRTVDPELYELATIFF